MTSQYRRNWICDTCGHPITRVDDGWVEWVQYPISEEERAARGLRLVHHARSGPSGLSCQYDQKVERKRDQGMSSIGFESRSPALVRVSA